MKTTIEIPDKLFRQAKARAAMEGLSLRELFLIGLRLALQTPPEHINHGRVTLPLVRAAQGAARLTDEQVATALDTDEDLL